MTPNRSAPWSPSQVRLYGPQVGPPRGPLIKSARVWCVGGGGGGGGKGRRDDDVLNQLWREDPKNNQASSSSAIRQPNPCFQQPIRIQSDICPRDTLPGEPCRVCSNGMPYRWIQSSGNERIRCGGDRNQESPYSFAVHDRCFNCGDRR